MTSNQLVYTLDSLPDPRGPHPYKLFIWERDQENLGHYQRLQVPPYQCYNIFSQLRPHQFWMDTAVCEVDGWARYQFKRDVVDTDIIDEAELEKDLCTLNISMISCLLPRISLGLLLLKRPLAITCPGLSLKLSQLHLSYIRLVLMTKSSIREALTMQAILPPLSFFSVR